MIIDIPFAYNIVFTKPMLMEIKATTSINYLKMKILTSKGGITMLGNKKMARECYFTTLKGTCQVLSIEALKHPMVEGLEKANPIGELRNFSMQRSRENSSGRHQVV